MISLNPRRALILSGASLVLSAVLLHTASAAPTGLDCALETARSAGFSVPESSLPATISIPPGVPVPLQQEPTFGGRTLKESEDFQMRLYIMALEPVDEAFCDGKLGVRNPKNEVEYRACRITRNFLWLIQNDPDYQRDNKGLFPDLAHIRYCRTAAEKKELFSRLKDASN